MAEEKEFDISAWTETQEAPKGQEQEDDNDDEKVIDYDKAEDWDDIKSSQESSEENEEDDEESIDLVATNKALGTSFKTIEELKIALSAKAKEEESEEEPAQEKQADTTDFAKFLDEDDAKKLKAARYFLGLPKDELLKRSIQQEWIDAGIVDKDEKGEWIFDEDDIEYELNQIKSDRSRYAASINKSTRQLEAAVKALKDKASVAKSEEDKKQSEAGKENRKRLQEELKKMDTFMGVKVDGKIRHAAYQDIVNGKFFEEVMSDQANIAELAIFRRMRKTLADDIGQEMFGKGKMAMFQKVNPSTKSGGLVDPNLAKGTGFDISTWK